MAKLLGISTLVAYASQEGNERALDAIRELRDPDAAPILAENLRGGTEAYQRAVLVKLRSLGDPRALRDLSRYLGAAPVSLAREAIEAIASVKDWKAARILEDFAARQSDPRLAGHAMRAATRVRSAIEKGAEERGRSGRAS